MVRHEALGLVDQGGQLPDRPVAEGELTQEPPADRMPDETDEKRSPGPSESVSWATTSNIAVRPGSDQIDLMGLRL